MICADRTAKYWQVSEGKCYTMQSDGDRNYIVLCNGNTIGGFSLSDGYIAGLVRYKKEFYALRICPVNIRIKTPNLKRPFINGVLEK